jgi:hypothetical protein
LVQEKNKASTEERYRELSKQFRLMNYYGNSAQIADECDKLADECVKQKEREKKERYDVLVNEKNNALSENKYYSLAQEFREMGNYENAVQLANECDNQMNVFKKQREENERQEKARIAAREAQEQAERERVRRNLEAQERKKQIAKNIRGLMFTFVPFILGLLLYNNGEVREEYKIILIISLIFVGGPLVIIHFRDDWNLFSIAAIIVFWIVIFPLTFNYNNYLGSIVMVVAFIIACAYPKKKYWD